MDYLTKFYKNKAASLQEQITILEQQIKLLEMDITMQTPEKIAAMNDPSKGGQSGKFGGDGKKSTSKKKTDSTTPPAATQPASQTSSDSGPNSDWAAQQRHSAMQDMVKDTLATAGKKDDFDTSLSLFGSSAKPAAKKYDAMGSADDLVAKAGGLLSSMNAKAMGSKSKQPTPPSAPQATGSTTTQTQSQPTSQGQSAPSIATSDYGRKPVQATSDPLRSTFKASGYIDRPDASSGLGSVQLDPADLKDAETKKWAQGQLEQEIGFETKRKTPMGTPAIQRDTDVMYKAPTSSYDAMNKFRDEEKEMIARVNKQLGTNFSQQQYAASKATAGVDVEGPSSDLKDMPDQPKEEKESLGSQLMRGFGDMGKALFGLNQSVADVGKKIQQRNAPKK